MEMTNPVPQPVMDFFHDEDYVDYVGCFVIASDQKFLIERVEDEDVAELAPPSGYLSVLERATWFTLTTF